VSKNVLSKPRYVGVAFFTIHPTVRFVVLHAQGGQIRAVLLPGGVRAFWGAAARTIPFSERAGLVPCVPKQRRAVGYGLCGV
jgi:hypothetical protein